MSQTTGEQIKTKSTPLNRVVDGTSNYAVAYNDSGELIETDTLKVFDNGDVEVLGTLSATSKLFTIDHPQKDGMKLNHSCLEGPEHAVFVRGVGQSSEIEWPEYWCDGLIQWDSVTVHLTPYGPGPLYIGEVNKKGFTVVNENNIKYSWIAYATRSDISELVLETIKS